jgi:hypothetical protein
MLNTVGAASLDLLAAPFFASVASFAAPLPFFVAVSEASPAIVGDGVGN